MVMSTMVPSKCWWHHLSQNNVIAIAKCYFPVKVSCGAWKLFTFPGVDCEVESELGGVSDEPASVVSIKLGKLR